MCTTFNEKLDSLFLLSTYRNQVLYLKLAQTIATCRESSPREARNLDFMQVKVENVDSHTQVDENMDRIFQAKKFNDE